MDTAPPHSPHPDKIGFTDVLPAMLDVPQAPGTTVEENEPETVITTISGHTWSGKKGKKGRTVSFRVEWEDNTVTWEPLRKIDDCIALDVYLRHHGLTDPLKLSKNAYPM